MGKSPLDHALDLFVFAPLGVVFAAKDALPDLIEKGRGRFEGQATTARMMGQMAVAQGQEEADKAVAEAIRRLADLGLVPKAPEQAPPAGGDEPPRGDGATTATEAAASPAGGPEGAAGPVPSAEDLAIPGYASLSAPQVVQRLAGLSMEELDAVRAYEAATRHRKTILTRIAQLQSPEP